jgi:hypothetical protein
MKKKLRKQFITAETSRARPRGIGGAPGWRAGEEVAGDWSGGWSRRRSRRRRSREREQRGWAGERRSSDRRREPISTRSGYGNGLTGCSVFVSQPNFFPQQRTENSHMWPWHERRKGYSYTPANTYVCYACASTWNLIHGVTDLARQIISTPFLLPSESRTVRKDSCSRDACRSISIQLSSYYAPLNQCTWWTNNAALYMLTTVLIELLLIVHYCNRS